jgi:hypothetical protein
MLSTEKTEKADATQPTEPTDRIEPAEPIDRIDPDDPIDRIEPLEPTDRIEPDEPADRSDPAGLADVRLAPMPLILPPYPGPHTRPGAWPDRGLFPAVRTGQTRDGQPAPGERQRPPALPARPECR